MSRLGEELVDADSRLEAEGLRLAEERRKLRVAINLGRYQRDLENTKVEASLKIANEARSRALEEAHEADCHIPSFWCCLVFASCLNFET